MNKINLMAFKSSMLYRLLPALNICTADDLVLDFVREMLSKCNKISHLLLDNSDPIGPIMNTFRPHVQQLSSIQLAGSQPIGRFCSEELHIVIGPDSIIRTDELLACCTQLDTPISLYFILRESRDLSKYLTANISALNIIPSDPYGYMPSCLSKSQNIPYSPHIKRLSLSQQRVDENLALALSKAVEAGNLPNVNFLGLRECEIKGKTHLLFRNKWPTLTHLDLYGGFLDESDIPILLKADVLLPNLTSLVLFVGDKWADFVKPTFASKFSDKYRLRFPRHITLFGMFQTTLPNMTELWLYSVNKQEYRKLIAAINKGTLPNLRELGVSMWEHVNENKMVDTLVGLFPLNGVKYDVIEQGNVIERLPPVNIQTLTSLTLHRFICTMYHLDMVTQSTVLTKLHKLDISHSSGMTGTLSILLCHNFPSLNTLTLRDCGINSKDLCSLAQARAKGRLPDLRHLDISRNESINGKLNQLFAPGTQWENLWSLIAKNVRSDRHVFLKDLRFCVQNTQQSNELAISDYYGNFLFQPGNPCWRNVQKVYIATDLEHRSLIQAELVDAVEKGLLPAVKRIQLVHSEGQRTSTESMKTFQHSVAHLLPSNVIEKVLKHSVTFMLPSVLYHYSDIFNDNFRKLMRGEKVPMPTVTEFVGRTDMSPVLLLVENQGLSSSQTEELITAIHTCLATLAETFVKDANEDPTFRKILTEYGIEYDMSD